MLSRKPLRTHLQGYRIVLVGNREQGQSPENKKIEAK
jgi:hypothetical protein